MGYIGHYRQDYRGYSGDTRVKRLGFRIWGSRVYDLWFRTSYLRGTRGGFEI